MLSIFDTRKELSKDVDLGNYYYFSNYFDDEDITKILNKDGYVISRRTISKYRKELNFPVARLRTKL